MLITLCLFAGCNGAFDVGPCTSYVYHIRYNGLASIHQIHERLGRIASTASAAKPTASPLITVIQLTIVDWPPCQEARKPNDHQSKVRHNLRRIPHVLAAIVHIPLHLGNIRSVQLAKHRAQCPLKRRRPHHLRRFP